MDISNRRTKVHNYSMWMKVISCILSFLMVLYAVPTSVFAEIASLASQVSAVGTDEITEKSTSAKIYEVVDRREETVKHFRSEDGSFTAVQYNMPVHEKDENGMWQDIDNTLISDGSEYATSNARIKFAKKTTGNGNLFTLHDGNRKITMSLSGANKKVAGQVTNARTDFAEDATQLQKMTTLDKLSSKILYQEILTGVDLEYVVESCNIKENIIVKERADSYNYTFEIKLNNLEAMLCEDGSVIISEPNADEVFYTIPKGYMFDSAGNCSDAVTYSLTNGGNGKYSLVVSADADWINNSDRTFPVTVDPTIEYDNYDHNNVVESTYVTSGDGFADANYFSDNHLYVGYSANKGYYSTYVQMKSMPTLPNNATIVDAKLHMMVSGVNNGSAYIGIYRVTESWSANTLTYSSKPNHNSTPIDYRKVGGTVGFDWDITTLVNQWVDGTYSNYGVVLSMVATSDSSAVITLKSERMTKSVPSFVITYRDTKGIEPYYSYYSSGADLAGAGKVNAFTGNLAFIHSSVSTTDEILPYTISLAYNSCLSGKYYVGGQNVITPIASASTGKGFKLSFDETIEKIDWGDDNELYVWADADGTEHYFSVFDYAWIDESINGYCDEDGLGLYLADEAEDETGTGYLMTDDTGNKKHFDSYGYLDYVEDSNGNRRKFYRNTYHKVTSISLTPNGGTEFNQLQLVYTSANGVLKTITSAQTGLTADMYYSSTYDGEATQDTSGFLRKIIYTYATNYTRTVLYEYDSSGYLTLTKDLKSGAAVNYTYSSTGKVTAITQYGKATETSTVSTMEQGQKARIRYGSLYSYYRTPGKDSIFGSSDDVYTYYRFDHSGRVISSHTTDSDLLYGAANCTYEDASVKTNNSLASVMQLSGNTVNYLNNPGFEELTYEDVPLYWNTSEECYGYANVINNYDTHLNMMVDCNNPIAYASQVFKLKAGTYTASAFFSRGPLSSNSRARIAIYDSSNTLGLRHTRFRFV